MPTPSRTSRADIVAAGRHILDAEGLDALTMQAVAIHVGVRPPSLYKYVADREALIVLVADAALTEIEALLAAAGTLPELARALRAWARAHPAAFTLAMSGRATQESLNAASEPILRMGARLASEQHALAAARLVTAWCTGFLTMELAGAFRLGGDLDESFEFALDRLTAALSPR
ncbi:TetR/AcrR family transcriptional regulator [Demequina sp. SO4-13]|uniref:TetR/AcrR family transcriptional regulator n=1 Tax=Demequina sp. SO4-13 TaxID=3401027 RepID=UPI003AF55E84